MQGSEQSLRYPDIVRSRDFYIVFFTLRIYYFHTVLHETVHD